MKEKITQILNRFLFALLFLVTFFSSAQEASTLVRGVVFDSGDRLPIPGATIAVRDKDNRTVNAVVTDFDGGFAIRINNPSNKLFVSMIGYKSKSVNFSGQTNIKVALVSSIETLTDVVVKISKKTETGLLNIAERDKTTSSVTIKASDLENTQAASIDEALQGRVAGLDITAMSGDPGAGMQIRIRGASSISGSSSPLVVVDGMAFETAIPSDFNFGTADEEGYAALLNIPPSDIESITIEKDAAATALWGARAAGGIIIINTKRGSVSAPKIGYSFTGTYSKLPNTIPMLNGDQYSQLIPEAVMNTNGTPLNTLFYKEFQYDPQDVYNYKNYSNNTNWTEAITQVGLTHDHNLSMSGGGEKARYYTSVSYYNQKGVTIGTGLDRITTRMNLDYVVSTRIRFKTNLAYTHTETKRNFVNGSGNGDGIRSVAYNKMPNMSIYEYNEFGELTPNLFTPSSNVQGSYSRTYNPVAMAMNASNNQIGERIVPQFSLSFDILPKIFVANFDLQFDFNNTKLKTFLPQNATGRPITETVVNLALDGDVDNTGTSTKTNFIFTPNMGEKHKLTTLLSLQSNDSRFESHQVQTSNTASTLLTDPSNPSRAQVSTSKLFTSTGQSRNVAAVVDAHYDLLDRYIVALGCRLDGNSKFGPNSRYGIFPTASARWRLSGEPFMKNIKSINDLSFRASYGQSGRAPKNDYLFYNQYVNYDTDYLGDIGVVSQNIELTNLKWETVTGKNVGMNLKMFNNRLSLDVDLYHNRTKDLFFAGLDLSTISGYSKLDRNEGTMDNQGWEIGLNTTPFISPNKKWKIDFNFNIASNQNIIREISPNFPQEDGTYEKNGSYKSFLQVDNPFGSFYGYRFKGVYVDKAATLVRGEDGNVVYDANGQTKIMRFNYPKLNYEFQPGDAIYEDINKDGNIDSRDVVYLGNSNPKYTGGFGTNLTYNSQFKFLMFFSYRLDYDVINNTDIQTTNMSGYDNQSTATLSRWRKEGDITNMPRAVFGGAFNSLGSDRYVEDASFVRLRSVTLQYSCSKELMKKWKMTEIRCFATVDNVFTLSNYRGQDPEVGMGPGAFGKAIDNSRTPPTRRVTLGIVTRF